MLRGGRQLVSDLLATSRACHACRQQVAGKLATLRPSRHVKMVWCIANKSPTSRRVRWTSGIWRATRQTDERTKDPSADQRMQFIHHHLFAQREQYKWWQFVTLNWAGQNDTNALTTAPKICWIWQLGMDWAVRKHYKQFFTLASISIMWTKLCSSGICERLVPSKFIRWM